jgi:hypothetical protein
MSRLYDGFPTLIEFGSFPNVKFWEINVTPPSMDGGGANDTTTMRNTAFRTKMPKKLKSMGDMTFTAAYDPVVYNDMWAMINDNQIVTVHFSDGSRVSAWGWLNVFTPAEIVEGAQPHAAGTIIFSNMDDNLNEVAPWYQA